MMKFCLLTIAFIAATVSAADFQLQAKNVCFGARGSQFGTFKVAKGGIVTALKLVHRSGAVTCNVNSNGLSNFGCNTNIIGAVVTTGYDKVIFPAGLDKRGWYTLPGSSSKSKQLVLKKPTGNNKVRKGQTLRLWYGEDLKHYTEGDNGGRSCVDVYAEIVPDFKIQAKNVCFGARGSQFGTFRLAKSGTITALKLVHRSGAVTCNVKSNGLSNFGCNTNIIGAVVTTGYDKVIFPAGLDWRGWYTLAGFSSKSKQLVLKKPTGNNKVRKGQTLRLWYGEDLKHYTEGDNGGRSCADVYADIQ